MTSDYLEFIGCYVKKVLCKIAYFLFIQLFFFFGSERFGIYIVNENPARM